MSGSRSLLPREHGAYAELAFPLLTGLFLARPTLPALALALAAVVFFLAHEPLAILLGARGLRLKDQEGKRARIRIILLVATGTLLGGLGVAGAGSPVAESLLVPTLPMVFLLPMVLTGRHKTVAGELLVVTVFAALVLPLGAATRVDPARVIQASVVWWLSFFLGTLEVHAIKARHKTSKRSQWTHWGSPVAAAGTVLLCLFLALFAEGPLRIPALAVLPPALGVLSLTFLQPHPRHLKRVGWTLVGANTLALVILLAFG